MSEPAVVVEREAGLARLWLNRPASRNAVNTGLLRALHDAVAALRVDESARLVVLRARGPVFSAGADRKERASMSEDEVRARRMLAFVTYRAFEQLPMPLVGVVEGPAIGSGCELVATCDLVIATTAATFSTPEAVLGTVGATQRLPRIIGRQLAKDMMFTGRKLSAGEAQGAGLVTRVVAPERLEAELEAVCASILAAPPRAMRLAKRCVEESFASDALGSLGAEVLAIEENLAGGEWRARMARFGDGEDGSGSG